MARDKREKEKRSPPKPGYVAMPWELILSPAFKELKPTAIKALLHFRGETQLFFMDRMFLKTNVSITYPKACKLGFGRTTFYDAICNLVAIGFIDPVSKGGLRGNGKTSAIFRNSDRWEQYGQKDFEVIVFKTWGT